VLGQTRFGGAQLLAARPQVGRQRVALGDDLVAFAAHLLGVGPGLQRLPVGLGAGLLGGGACLLRDLGGGPHPVELGLRGAKPRARLLQRQRSLLGFFGLGEPLVPAGELLAGGLQGGGELFHAPRQPVVLLPYGGDRGVGGLRGPGRLGSHVACRVAFDTGRLQPGGQLDRLGLDAPRLVAYVAELGESLLGLPPCRLTLPLGEGETGRRLGPRLGQPPLDAGHAQASGEGDRQELGDVFEPLDHVPGPRHLAGEAGAVLVATAPLGRRGGARPLVVRAVPDRGRGVAVLGNRPPAVRAGPRPEPVVLPASVRSLRRSMRSLCRSMRSLCRSVRSLRGLVRGGGTA